MVCYCYLVAKNHLLLSLKWKGKNGMKNGKCVQRYVCSSKDKIKTTNEMNVLADCNSFWQFSIYYGFGWFTASEKLLQLITVTRLSPHLFMQIQVRGLDMKFSIKEFEVMVCQTLTRNRNVDCSIHITCYQCVYKCVGPLDSQKIAECCVLKAHHI